MSQTSTIQDVATYLQTITIPMRLACTSPTGWPIVLSLWYLYEAGLLYGATQQEAKVVYYLQQNPRCAFEIAADSPPYCGVRGQALATIEKQRGSEILQRLLVRYVGSTTTPLAQKLLRQQDTEVALILEPQSLYRWNFSQRMAESVPLAPEKPCP